MSYLILFERCQSSCKEHGISDHYKTILSTVGFDPPTPHGLQITSPPLSPLGQNLLDTKLNLMSMKFINMRSINKPEKVHVYIASSTCQFQPYNVWILFKNNNQISHLSIGKTIQMLYHVTAANTCAPCWSCVRTQVHMFIYRSYIYKFHGYLIPSHTKQVVAEWW